MTPLLPDDFVGKCVRHFAHACEKHPKFANALSTHETMPGSNAFVFQRHWDIELSSHRRVLRGFINDRQLTPFYIARCELAEVASALEHEDSENAKEELYDLIAVCMRTICVLEGKQELAKGVCE